MFVESLEQFGNAQIADRLRREADIRNLDLSLKLEVGERLVNCATGAMWHDPTPND